MNEPSRRIAAGFAAGLLVVAAVVRAFVEPDGSSLFDRMHVSGEPNAARGASSPDESPRGAPSTSSTVTTTPTAPASTSIAPTPPSSTVTTVPEPCEPRPLSVCNGRLAIDGVIRPILGINSPGASSALRFGSPCGYPDLDLDQMFAVLPERSLVRVWFTQRTARDGDPPLRAWDRLDEVVAAAERSPTRPLLVVTLAASAGYCDGDVWRNREWFDSGYAVGPDPGVSNSYLGWVDEAVRRYAARDVVAMWEPINEAEPADCRAGAASPCWGRSTCAPGGARSVAAFYEAVGTRIHELDPDAIVSTGGRGWCGWSTPEEITLIESTPAIDVISIHAYPADPYATPDIGAIVAHARRLGKPLFVGELGRTATSSSASRAERADALTADTTAYLDAGADAVALWTYGFGTPCDLCLMADDPMIDRLHEIARR